MIQFFVQKIVKIRMKKIEQIINNYKNHNFILFNITFFIFLRILKFFIDF